MSVRKKVSAVPSSTTLYGTRFSDLERLCYENHISTTAFYNTVIEAFATGALQISGGDSTRRRVSGVDAEEVLEQLRFEILDRDGHKIA